MPSRPSKKTRRLSEIEADEQDELDYGVKNDEGEDMEDDDDDDEEGEGEDDDDEGGEEEDVKNDDEEEGENDDDDEEEDEDFSVQEIPTPEPKIKKAVPSKKTNQKAKKGKPARANSGARFLRHGKVEKARTVSTTSGREAQTSTAQSSYEKSINAVLKNEIPVNFHFPEVCPALFNPKEDSSISEFFMEAADQVLVPSVMANTKLSFLSDFCETVRKPESVRKNQVIGKKIRAAVKGLLESLAEKLTAKEKEVRKKAFSDGLAKGRSDAGKRRKDDEEEGGDDDAAKEVLKRASVKVTTADAIVVSKCPKVVQIALQKYGSVKARNAELVVVNTELEAVLKQEEEEVVKLREALVDKGEEVERLKKQMHKATVAAKAAVAAKVAKSPVVTKATVGAVAAKTAKQASKAAKDADEREQKKVDDDDGEDEGGAAVSGSGGSDSSEDEDEKVSKASVEASKAALQKRRGEVGSYGRKNALELADKLDERFWLSI